MERWRCATRLKGKVRLKSKLYKSKIETQQVNEVKDAWYILGLRTIDAVFRAVR